MIKYLGSKRRLVPHIVAIVEALEGVRTVFDVFSGTSRVGHALKRAGYRVVACDHNAYAEVLARCYVQADAEDVLAEARRLVAELDALPGRPGFFTETYCERARFFHPRNGARIDAMRERIAAWSLPPELEAVLLVALMEAADRVDSTTGVQMAYLKQWAPRALRPLALRVPDVLPRARWGKGRALRRDALEAAHEVQTDVAYVDPPYNQHSYLGNYHIWETLVRWDHPPVYGVACKREDVRRRRSPFNSQRTCAAALRRLLETLHTDTIILSFSDEGFVSREAIEGMLGSLWGGRACRATLVIRQRRYVGAQIGIHDPRGRKVGRVSHLHNREYLFVASRRPLPGRLLALEAAVPLEATADAVASSSAAG